MFLSAAVVALSINVAQVSAQTYSATYTPDNLPDHSEDGQSGTNKCGTGYSQTSMCQNAYINSVTDFCVFAPPEPGAGSTIGETERIEVAWCMQGNYGTRIIPDGTVQGAHFVQTPDYVQITGWGDFTKMNIPKGDEGGELDPHGADGNGNPVGGLVFSSAFTGKAQQLHEWTNFMSDTEFCIRGCKDGKNAPALCQHIYDEMGCQWNMPGNYAVGSFDDCKGDSGEPMGVYGASTFHQGDAATPDPHPAPATSACTPLSTISNGLAAASSASGAGGSSAPVQTTTALQSASGSAQPTARATSASNASSRPASSTASAAGSTQTNGGQLSTAASALFVVAAAVGAVVAI